MRGNLRNARLARGLTQEALGGLVGRTRFTICDLERCRRDGSMRMWDRLEEVLQIDQKMLRRVDNPESDADR